MNKVLIICIIGLVLLLTPMLLIMFFGTFLHQIDDGPNDYFSKYLIIHMYIMPFGLFVCITYPIFYKIKLLDKERKECEK